MFTSNSVFVLLVGNRSNVMSATKVKEEPCDVFETQLAVFEQDVLLPRSSCRQTTASLQCQSSDGVTHDGNVVCSDIQIDYTGNFVEKPYIKSESCEVETAENSSLQRVRIKCEVDEIVASSTGETTQWMVCENDALGGVWKVEKTDWPSETYAVQDCTDNTEDVDKPHVCSMCGKLFVSYSQLEEHMCSKVGMLYKQSSSLTTHEQSDMHGDKTTCGGSSAHSGDRTAGERRERDEETSTCFLCGKSFAEHSKGEQLYTCGTCGRSFKQSCTLDFHEKILHAGVTSFSCSQCGRLFTELHALKTHELMHTKVHERRRTGIKPFTCSICRKSFVQYYGLKTHELIHTGVKPYTCDICGKSFRQRITLKNHEVIHSEVKPYTCDTCGKSFRQHSTLKNHERIHTGVKPYTCDTCGKSFRQHSTLKNHEKKIHSSVKHT